MYNSWIKYIIVLMLVVSTNILFCQSENDVKKIYKTAENYFSVENYISAYPLLKKLETISEKKSNVKYMLAICEMKFKNNYAASINLFESIKINFSEEECPNELYNLLGDAYHFEYDFDNAIKNYKVYKGLLKKDENLLKLINRKIETSKNAKLIYASPKKYELNNLWVRINSSWEDYAPVISADETTLIFTSKRGAGINSEPDINGNYYSDVYISQKNSDNEWGYAKLIHHDINTKYHDVSSCVTADGQKLYVHRSKKNEKEGEIFKSYLSGSEWDEPVSLGNDFNSNKYIKNVTITPDEQTLYFTSKRADGYGESDIYVSRKTTNGTWGTAENLGANVNTIYDEESPFIHPDGRTLFFSSKGHNTMGGYDVFKSVFDGDSWSTPENLGYPLNSAKDDLHFVLSANGQNGYYTSVRKDGYGKEDIYQIKMPNNNIPLTMIRGKILCADSLKPLDVNIKVRDVETGEFIRHVYKPNPETGKYLIILPPGKNYDMVISTAGYIPYKMNVFIPNQKEFYELYQTIYLKALQIVDKKLGQGISVDNSFFNSEGVIKDIDEELRKEQLRQERLQDLLNNIINTSDSLSMNNLNEVVASNFEETYQTLSIDSSFNSLLSFIDQVFENTDSTAIKHANNLIERGFYTYAENNIYSYGSSDNLKDTLLVTTNNFELVNSSNNKDSLSFGTVENENGGDNTIILAGHDLFNIGAKDTKFLKTVLFEYKKHDIDPSYFKKLKDLIFQYKNSSKKTFKITGYTDDVGSIPYNEKLSQKRVKSIEKFLINNGVSPDKIKSFWKGESNPVKSNNSEEERAKNRRVEIRLIASNK